MDGDLSVYYVDLQATLRYYRPMECPRCGCVVDYAAIGRHEAWHEAMRNQPPTGSADSQ